MKLKMKMKMNKTGAAESNAKPCENGFSLIEVVISMVIFLIVTASIYGLLQIGRIDRNRASRRSDVLKNARVAIHLIGRDALNAGLGFHRHGAVVPENFLASNLGIPPDADEERDTLTSIIAGNDLFPNDLADEGEQTDLIAFAYRDVDFNGGSVVNLSNVAVPSDQPSVAQLQTSAANGAVGVQANDLFLIESDTSQVAIMASGVSGGNTINVAPNDPLDLNLPMDGAGAAGSMLRRCVSQTDENCTTYLASLKRFFWVSYKIKPDGTLIRTLYGNNRAGVAAQDQIQEQPLAYNVQNFQVRYVLKNGEVTDNPGAGADGKLGTEDDEDTTEKLNLIRQIIVTVRVLSTEVDEQTKKPISVTLSATFSTRNLQYDAG